MPPTPTDSTEGILNALRTRLLTYAPAGGGATVQTRLGGRLYKNKAPDNAVYPMGIMRLFNRATDGAYDGERFEGDIEVTLYGNSDTQAVALENTADVCDQAMTRLRLHDPAAGIIFSRQQLARDTLPPPVDPADRDVVQIRLLYHLIVWPRYLHTVAT